MTTFSKEELEAMRLLVVRTSTNINLQKKTGLNLVKSMQLVEKIDILLRDLPSIKLDEEEKDMYDISYDDVMIITDTQHEIEYRINSDLVHNGKVAGYLIEDRQDAISNIESWLAESESESDKYLMREDLETLRESCEDYVFTYYGTNGFICKDIDIKEFNKVCQELIESFTSYQNGESK